MYWPVDGGRFPVVNEWGVTLFCSSTWAGPVLEGCQLFPPSMLNSVKMSKKLFIWNMPSACFWIRTPPREGRVGLSRITTPVGRSPPWRLSATISVSKRPSSPEEPRLITCTETAAGARAGRKVCPPSVESIMSTCELNVSIWSPPGGGGGNDWVKKRWRMSEMTMPGLPAAAYAAWNCAGVTYSPSGSGNRGLATAIGATAAGSLCSSTGVGCVEGDQLCPPSRLISVNTSKKLLTMKPPCPNWRLVRPIDCRLGLSRSITPGGSVPPEMSS